MKKQFTYLLAGLLALSLCACGGSTDKKTEPNQKPAPQETTVAPTQQATTEFESQKVKNQLQVEHYSFKDDNDENATTFKLTNSSEFNLYLEIEVSYYTTDGKGAANTMVFVEALGAGQTMATLVSTQKEIDPTLTKVEVLHVRECDSNLVPLGNDYSYTSTLETFDSSKGTVYKEHFNITNASDITAKNLYLGIIYKKDGAVVDALIMNFKGKILPNEVYEWAASSRIEHDSMEVYFYGEAEK